MDQTIASLDQSFQAFDLCVAPLGGLESQAKRRRDLDAIRIIGGGRSFGSQTSSMNRFTRVPSVQVQLRRIVILQDGCRFPGDETVATRQDQLEQVLQPLERAGGSSRSIDGSLTPMR